MKRIFYLTMVLLSVAAFVACDDTPVEVVDPQLDVTAHNISGTWMLESWKGSSLADGSYVYIDFERRDCSYKLYQNLGSFSTQRLTGRFYIEVDEAIGGAVIRGNYDYDRGDWSHRYIVTSLTANKMTWVAKDNVEDESVYVRAEIPSKILDEAGE